MNDLSARQIERIKWGRETIPADTADRIEAKLREWLSLESVFTLTCTFPLKGEDLWCQAVVEHLRHRGWTAVGERRLTACDCDLHQGAKAPSDWFTVTVSRPRSATLPSASS